MVCRKLERTRRTVRIIKERKCIILVTIEYIAQLKENYFSLGMLSFYTFTFFIFPNFHFLQLFHFSLSITFVFYNSLLLLLLLFYNLI